MRFDFDRVDAFGGQPFGGDGCAVLHGRADRPDRSGVSVMDRYWITLHGRDRSVT